MIERLAFSAMHRIDPERLSFDAKAPLDGQRGSSADAPSEAVERAKVRERMRLDGNLASLPTLGSSAPFIGLLGTVLGISKWFHDLSAAQATGSWGNLRIRAFRHRRARVREDGLRACSTMRGLYA